MVVNLTTLAPALPLGKNRYNLPSLSTYTLDTPYPTLLNPWYA